MLTRGVVGLNAAKIVFCNLVPALLEGRANVSLQLHAENLGWLNPSLQGVAAGRLRSLAAAAKVAKDGERPRAWTCYGWLSDRHAKGRDDPLCFSRGPFVTPLYTRPRRPTCNLHGV